MQNILFARKQCCEMLVDLKSAKYGRKYVYGDLRESSSRPLSDMEIICAIWYLTTRIAAHIKNTDIRYMAFFHICHKSLRWNAIYIYFFLQALVIERIIICRDVIHVIHIEVGSCARARRVCHMCALKSSRLSFVILCDILRQAKFISVESIVATLISSRSTSNVCCK